METVGTLSSLLLAVLVVVVMVVTVLEVMVEAMNGDVRLLKGSGDTATGVAVLEMEKVVGIEVL